MFVTITEERYGFMQLAAQIEITAGLIFILLAGIATEISLFMSVIGLIFSVLSTTRGLCLLDRGLSHRLYSLFMDTNEWVLDDLDEFAIQEMRETGSVQVDVPR